MPDHLLSGLIFVVLHLTVEPFCSTALSKTGPKAGLLILLLYNSIVLLTINHFGHKEETGQSMNI